MTNPEVIDLRAERAAIRDLRYQLKHAKSEQRRLLNEVRDLRRALTQAEATINTYKTRYGGLTSPPDWKTYG